MGRSEDSISMPGEADRMYGQKSYWLDRYTQESDGDFEWYQSYAQLQPQIKAAFPDTSAKIVNLGCGNSKLGHDMYQDGYKSITNIDFAENIITEMQKKYGDACPEMEWKVTNVREMTEIPSGSFKYAVDKGTLDSLLCGANSTSNAYKYLCEIKRILEPGGTLLILSYGGEAKREVHLKRAAVGFSAVSCQKIPKPTAAGVQPSASMDPNHFLYTCKC